MLDFITNAVIWVLALYGLIEIIKNIYYICTCTNLESDGIYFIIAVKNQEEKIEGFMRSILFRILYGKEECIKNVIITDLGSTDKTKEIENENFGGTISIFAYSIDNLNPLLTKFKTNAQALSLIYDSLFVTEQNLNISEDASKSYRFTNKGHTLYVFLKKDIKRFFLIYLLIRVSYLKFNSCD